VAQALQLPEASLGGGGDGEGSLIAAAVVVNTDDTVITLHIQYGGGGQIT
jgi:hypothetical protein